MGSVNSPNASGLQRQKMQTKKVVHIQETSEDSETKCMSAWKTTCRHLRKMTGWDL